MSNIKINVKVLNIEVEWNSDEIDGLYSGPKPEMEFYYVTRGEETGNTDNENFEKLIEDREDLNDIYCDNFGKELPVSKFNKLL